MSQWKAIAENYAVERDGLSLPALLTDKLIVSLVGQTKGGRVLDFGAGSGTLTRLLHTEGHSLIAYEPTDEMRQVFAQQTASSKYNRVTLLSTLSEVEKLNKLDTVICLNVVDHLKDVSETFRLFKKVLTDKGRLVLSIPHPIKNLGAWVKEGEDNNWKYLYYRLDDYLKEGEVKRNREDVKGNLIIKDVVSQHRTISTYYNWVRDAGFDVVRMHEPGPQSEDFTKFPAHCAQSSRIPYFWVLDCVARDVAPEKPSAGNASKLNHLAQ